MYELSLTYLKTINNDYQTIRKFIDVNKICLFTTYDEHDYFSEIFGSDTWKLLKDCKYV